MNGPTERSWTERLYLQAKRAELKQKEETNTFFQGIIDIFVYRINEAADKGLYAITFDCSYFVDSVPPSSPRTYRLAPEQVAEVARRLQAAGATVTLSKDQFEITVNWALFA